MNNKEYVEQSWRISHKREPKHSASEEERVRETISLIPEDCSSVLEVGCGNGAIINHLVSRYGRVCGLDLSEAALKYVKAEKIVGSLESLPFPDKSYDLVLCCEALEHLPFQVYPNALKEIERVALRYIIVTVPNENLAANLVKCPYCGCYFHPSRHVRSFNLRILKGLFTQFSLQTFKLCQPFAKGYPQFMVRVAKLIGLIPGDSFPVAAICPQCGYSLLSADETLSKEDYNATDKATLSLRLLRSLAKWLIPIRKKQGGWLMAFYRRR